VADFHGLPVPPAKSIFIRSLCGVARSVNRAPRFNHESQLKIAKCLFFPLASIPPQRLKESRKYRRTPGHRQRV
jgi:hypothetical protein